MTQGLHSRQGGTQKQKKFLWNLLNRLREGRSVGVCSIYVTTYALIKKKIKFSSYIRKFRMGQLQNDIWKTASSYMGKYLRISSYIRKPFLMWLCNCSTLNFLIYEENFISFLSVSMQVYKHVLKISFIKIMHDFESPCFYGGWKSCSSSCRIMSSFILQTNLVWQSGAGPTEGSSPPACWPGTRKRTTFSRYFYP